MSLGTFTLEICTNYADCRGTNVDFRLQLIRGKIYTTGTDFAMGLSRILLQILSVNVP